MSRPFAVFDIDGTLIRWQLFHAIINTLAKEGYLGEDAHQTIKKARQTWKTRTHADAFEDYQLILIDIFLKQVKHVPTDIYDTFVEATLQEYRDQTYVYTRNLLRELKAKGYLLFAISGSQRELVEQLAKYYGFDDWTGSTFERKGGAFTGRLFASYAGKHKTLRELVKKHRASFKGSVAVGDSNNDISLLDLAEHPIAFNPDRALFKHAKSNGWDIIIERKNMIYKLESKHGRYILAEADS